jgi:hypothetical protein
MTTSGARDQLVEQGTLHQTNKAGYLDSLLLLVQYWTDSGWVSEEQLRRLPSH